MRSALQPFVDPADLGAVGILQIEDRGILATKVGLGDLNPAVPLRPGEDGLNLKALPDALFVICRDPLGGRGFDIVDPERPLHRHLAGHRGVAGVAALDFAVMAGAAVRADEDVSGGELRPVSRSDFRRQLRLHDSVGAAFVIDQAARPELRDSQEAGALEERAGLSHLQG